MSISTKTQHGGAVLRITLNKPKANVLDGATMSGIEEAVRAAADGVKAIVFDHEGPHFSFGASVEEHTADKAAAMLECFHGLFRTLADKAIPTVALVRGRCLGGGLELASYCTWLCVAPDAKLGQPEIKLAVFPPMASVILPWRVGGGPAMDLCVSGRVIGAEEALRIGLASAIAEDPAVWWDDFFAEELEGASAAALRYAERAVRGGLVEAIAHRLPVLERLYLDELMKTHDANEGIRAFMAKEKPAFKDR